MKLSNTEKDFERIIEGDHIDQVLAAFDDKIPHYFQEISEFNKVDPNNDMAMKLLWRGMMQESVEDFQKDSEAYNEFFSEESMDEFEEIDDPKVFKGSLRNDCPIIRKSLMSRMEELQNWKEDFARAKPQEMLETFANFLDFVRQYADDMKSVDYSGLSKSADFEELAQFSEDADLSLQKVIGAGIKTTIIYNLFPQYLCKSVRRTLYGMYFLSLDIHDQMPSRTSEFVMVDDTNMHTGGRGASYNFRMEHNYWYPFNLFMCYSKHISDKLNELLAPLGIHLAEEYRYVYVNRFLESICKVHGDAIRTMMGGDQDT
ncbi:MAG: hypothetical protein JXQ96_17660 [Cyclobacteriaceae bacterium]